MEKISLQVFIHRNQECIGIFFAKNDLLNIAVKKIPGIKWSQTHKCWWLPLSKENYAVIIKATGSKTNIETGALKKYLEKKNKITASKTPAKENASKPTTILPTGSGLAILGQTVVNFNILSLSTSARARRISI